MQNTFYIVQDQKSLNLPRNARRKRRLKVKKALKAVRKAACAELELEKRKKTAVKRAKRVKAKLFKADRKSVH